MLVLKLCLVAVTFQQIWSHKILCVFPTARKSHWLIGSSIGKILADNGHDVTIIGPYPIETYAENYRSILLTGLVEEHEEKAKQFNSLYLQYVPLLLVFQFLFSTGNEMSDYVLGHKNVIELMKSNEVFDLIIVENFCMDALIGFGQYYKAPVVSVSTFGASKWTSDLIGNPTPHSYVPHPLLSYTGRMSFSQRFKNLFTTIVETALMNFYYLPKSKEIYDKRFPNPKPDFYEVYKNVSLVFLNTHFTFGTPRPYLPNMIEIGGIQINGNLKPLPPDLRSFMESAKDGVIYFSMGTNIKGVNFPYDKQQAFVKVFARLKQKVIWKFENETIDNQPENLLIRKWLPQSDILAHSNTKLFITHGGLLSTTEAVYHAVPIVAIPIFADQEFNVAEAELAGWGVKLDYKNLTEDSISWAIKHAIDDTNISRNIKIVSKRYHQQPMTPQATLIYWVDYVISTDGAPHIKSAGQNLNFIEYHLIDVIALMFLIVFVSAFSWWWLMKIFFRKVIARCRLKWNKNSVRPKTD